MGEQVEGVRLSTNPSNAARRRFIPETFHSLLPAARMSIPISDAGRGRAQQKLWRDDDMPRTRVGA